ELAVRPEQRNAWKNVVYIEAAPPGKLTVVTLFIVTSEAILRHENEPSFCLAHLKISEGRYAQLVAHGEQEGDAPQLIARSRDEAIRRVISSGQEIPDDAYAYFFGVNPNGSRFIIGARLIGEQA